MLKLLKTISIQWHANLTKTSFRLNDLDHRDLFCYGITIGWLFIGIFIAEQEAPGK